jgi:hypothetical protein
MHKALGSIPALKKKVMKQKGIITGRKEVKLSLFISYMIIFIQNFPKNQTYTSTNCK